MRLIDADKLLEIYRKWMSQISSKEYDGDRRGVGTCIIVLEDMLNMNSIEVVRCKDCIYSYEEFGFIYCTFGPYGDCKVPSQFYCAEGKRKENK